MVRPPAFAGTFYPRAREACEQAVQAALPKVASDEPGCIGAIAPHAGWRYSGPTAALAISSLAGASPETIVIFGAVHVVDRNEASLYPSGAWDTPLGSIEIDEELARQAARARGVIVDPGVHRREHSIEVLTPFIRALAPEARIVPLMIRPGQQCDRIGRDVAAAAKQLGRRVVFVASTDLTHYGPMFGFEPHGRGLAGVRWAKEVNDRRFIERVADFDATGVVPEALAHQNACGSGAVAATIAAVAEWGASSYRELDHVCSFERESHSGVEPLDSVGYEAGVFCR